MDQNHNIHAVMRCENQAYVVSHRLDNAGWSAPTLLPLPQEHLLGVTVQGGPSSTTYVVAYVMAQGLNQIHFLRTTDGGQSWGEPTLLIEDSDLNVHPSVSQWEGHIVSHGDSVYISAFHHGGIYLWSNHNRGQGAFHQTQVPFSMPYGATVLDRVTGHLWLVGDNPQIYTHQSTDSGLSFGPRQGPLEREGMTIHLFCSRWVQGRDSFFGFGTCPGSDWVRFSLPEGTFSQDIPMGMQLREDMAHFTDGSGDIYITESHPSSLGIHKLVDQHPQIVTPIYLIPTESHPRYPSVAVSPATGITAMSYTTTSATTEGSDVWLWGSI